MHLRKTCFHVALLIGGLAAPTFAQSTLSPENSAELQKLLRNQNQQAAVFYSNFALPSIPANTYERLFLWNQIGLDTTAIDHTPTQPGDTRVFGEQFGPTRASRAMAVVNIAMFEAVNATTHKYVSYAKVTPVTGDVSVDYAIAQAAHDALLYLYPSQVDRLNALLASDVSHISDNATALAAGQQLGRQAANKIQLLRTNDGSQIPEPRVGGPFTLMNGVGHWTPDPISKLSIYLGAFWSNVKPFTLNSSSQFRAPEPPALTDALYTSAFKQVKAIGGDPNHGTLSTRTEAQTVNGIFWSYEGTPAICAPPRIYNQIARTIVLQQGMTDVTDAARVFALINTAMADAAIAAWETKYHYQFWRPVTGIRSNDQGGNSSVIPDTTWYPLGGQDTNTHGPNFTPPFPAYVSGHSAIGGSMFQIMRHIYPDATPFTFTSDEWNGVNRDINGNIRPAKPLTFTSFTDAEQQNSESRVDIGVHWQFDADQGKILGDEVGDWVWSNSFQPVNLNGTHTLTPQNATGSRMDDSGAMTTTGNPIDIFTANGTAAQNWTFSNTNVVPEGNYNLATLGSFCVTASGDTLGSLVNLQPCKGSPAQSWNAVLSQGTYLFHPANNPSLCLDVKENHAANGTPLQIFTCNSLSDEQWRIN